MPTSGTRRRGGEQDGRQRRDAATAGRGTAGAARGVDLGERPAGGRPARRGRRPGPAASSAASWSRLVPAKLRSSAIDLLVAGLGVVVEEQLGGLGRLLGRR